MKDYREDIFSGKGLKRFLFRQSLEIAGKRCARREDSCTMLEATSGE